MRGGQRRRGAGWARSARALGALVVAATVLSACSATRAVLAPRVDVCYRAVPVAKSAVGGKGRLVIVAHTDTRSLLRTIERAGGPRRPPEALAVRTQRVCVIAYRGRYAARDVREAWVIGPAPDRFAVVVVRDRDTRTLATILVGARPRTLVRALSLTG